MPCIPAPDAVQGVDDAFCTAHAAYCTVAHAARRPTDGVLASADDVIPPRALTFRRQPATLLAKEQAGVGETTTAPTGAGAWLARRVFRSPLEVMA